MAVEVLVLRVEKVALHLAFVSPPVPGDLVQAVGEDILQFLQAINP
jgi:hypothetical protein